MFVAPHTVYDQLPMPQDAASREEYVQRRQTYRLEFVPDHVAAVEAIVAAVDGHSAVVISDETVNGLLPTQRIKDAIKARGILLDSTAVPAGERSKSLGTAVQLIDWLADIGFARRDVLIGVGGGMIMDLVGFVASVFMRGVPYINVPTTLLAQVDAAVGGKVGVDHVTAKNLVGAFWQPRVVVSSTEFLDTLDRRQVRAGLAEVVKEAVIASPDLFAYIEANAEGLLVCEPELMSRLVVAASVIKCELIDRDPFEVDLRRPLNFGHTVGHAVEAVTGYGPVLHGEAVACGMGIAVRVAANRGLIDSAFAYRVIGLLGRLGLPTRLDQLPVVPEIEHLLDNLAAIRRIRDGSLRFVLPLGLGSTVIVDDVTDDEVRSALSLVGPEAAG
ncbi:3-dehydroquinate synthase [Micromonospora arborensis]|uniref:3-dehydroquinate synthase n=1 Tax=Micromonospora arborensis TaxID=2116518 RepID=UPI00341A4D00